MNITLLYALHRQYPSLAEEYHSQISSSGQIRLIHISNFNTALKSEPAHTCGWWFILGMHTVVIIIIIINRGHVYDNVIFSINLQQTKANEDILMIL